MACVPRRGGVARAQQRQPFLFAGFQHRRQFALAPAARHRQRDEQAGAVRQLAGTTRLEAAPAAQDGEEPIRVLWITPMRALAERSNRSALPGAHFFVLLGIPDLPGLMRRSK